MVLTFDRSAKVVELPLFEVQRKGGRGRPAKESFNDHCDLQGDAAYRVHHLFLKLGGRRRDKTAALERIAAEMNQSKEWTKKAYQRRPVMRSVAALDIALEQEARRVGPELIRRLAGLPTDVREALSGMPINRLMRTLRILRING